VECWRSNKIIEKNIVGISVNKIIKLLKKEYSLNQVALEFRNPLQLLVSTMLSAQCTDERVNKVTPFLFKKYRKASDYAEAELNVFQEEIRSTGFYKNKAKNIIACCKELADRYNGDVPSDIEELTRLPGVGRKTANVVLGNAFGIPAVVVDTHVKRLSYRLGLTKNTKPEKIEYDIIEIIPRREWIQFSNALIYHGRKICNARNPKCDVCILRDFCPKVGVKYHKGSEGQKKKNKDP